MGDDVEFPPKPFTREEALAVLVYQNPVSPRAVMALKPAQLERQIDLVVALRIEAHKRSRPGFWHTLETPMGVGEAVKTFPESYEIVLLDCLTLLTTNVLLSLPEDVGPQVAEGAIDAEIEALLDAYATSDAEWMIVSNEVGLGLVPPYPLGRLYRDFLGRANQRLACEADSVLFMVAGIPMVVK